MASLDEIRQTFLSYFEQNNHELVTSAPLVPQDDPSLLFVNAGMVPFKNIFTGAQKSQFPRAVSAQKCVRAGGKHNDLENVGYTARHHTFFEMLGNFSFGDYFKERAIELAWRLVTQEFGLPEDRLLVTVYAEDGEAADLWKKIAGLSEERIIPINSSDNFWSMGATGPCGPCSEIFYDHGENIAGGPPGSPDKDGDRFVEIWNLVFMQFEQQEDGSRSDLPKPSIDTGMGLERIAAILQSVHSNYETDLFQNLISAAAECLQVKPDARNSASFRAIADHIRSINFLLADGVTPVNEGRGYVLRRIIRRAMRHGHLLGARKPFLFHLCDDLEKFMGKAYPELTRALDANRQIMQQEEERFLRTLDTGMGLLKSASCELPAGAKFSGETAFKLYDTYGFPLDLTKDVLRPMKLTVDEAEFDREMQAQKERARAGWTGSGDKALGAVWQKMADQFAPTLFVGYEKLESDAKMLALLNENFEQIETLEAQQKGYLLLDQTPFYAESGGQAGDQGWLIPGDARAKDVNENWITVSSVTKPAGLHVHHIKAGKAALRAGQELFVRVDTKWRQPTKANHSATHLLHEALRRVLGNHVAQKGQMVDRDRIRFDFAHFQPVSADELRLIEDQVNQVIRANTPTKTQLMTPGDAIEKGAIALFGEKYDDEVRVLTLGMDPDAINQPYSIELCGGTHVAKTGDIGLFVIQSESAVAAGIRRIEALTGEEAFAFLRERRALLEAAALELKTKPEELPGQVRNFKQQKRKLEGEIKQLRNQLMSGGSGSGVGPVKEEIGNIIFVHHYAEGVPGKELRALVDKEKANLENGVVLLMASEGKKVTVAVGVTAPLHETLSAIELVRVAAQELGGKGGGGRSDLAVAGGQNPDGCDQAIAVLRKKIQACPG